MSNDHRAKLEWARKHFEDFNDQINRFLETAPYEVAAYSDAVSAEHVVYFEKVRPVPSDWALRIGDSVHNLRSSLDAMTYSLAVKGLGRHPTGQEVKTIQFVIVDKQSQWPGEAGRRLKHLSKDARDVIEKFQPYHGPQPSRYRALAVLRELSNIDKHRHLHVALAAAAASSVRVSGPTIPKGLVLGGYTGELKEGAEISRWRFLKPGPYPKMEVEPQLTVEIEVEVVTPDWLARVPIVSLLSTVHQIASTEIFPALERLL